MTAPTDSIARLLAARGIEVDRVVAVAGAIHAICHGSEIEELRAMDGISGVEPDTDVTLPPRDPQIPQ